MMPEESFVGSQSDDAMIFAGLGSLANLDTSVINLTPFVYHIIYKHAAEVRLT
jgi:hypothetical protein